MRLFKKKHENIVKGMDAIVYQLYSKEVGNNVNGLANINEYKVGDRNTKVFIYLQKLTDPFVILPLSIIHPDIILEELYYI